MRALLIALGFFAKQTATIVGIGIGVGLLVANWRRGLVYGAAAAARAGGRDRPSGQDLGRLVLDLHLQAAPEPRLSQGGGHRHRLAVYRSSSPGRCFSRCSWPRSGLALSRKLRRSDAILWAAALAGEIAALVGFATQWADSNAFIPAVYFPAFAAAVLVARLAVRGAGRPEMGRGHGGRRRGSAPGRAEPAHGGALAGARPAARRPSSSAGPSPAAPCPRSPARCRARRIASRPARLLAELRALPSPLFIPFHTYYAVLAGKQPFVHRMGVHDVEAALGRPTGLDQAIAEQRFAAIVLDWKSYPGEWPNLDARYHVARELSEGVDSVRMFAGAQTSPNRIYLPRRSRRFTNRPRCVGAIHRAQVEILVSTRSPAGSRTRGAVDLAGRVVRVGDGVQVAVELLAVLVAEVADLAAIGVGVAVAAEVRQGAADGAAALAVVGAVVLAVVALLAVGWTSPSPQKGPHLHSVVQPP